MAKIIAFEGPDQCGKATQSNLLKCYLERKKYKVKLIEIPVFDCTFYYVIYRMLNSDYALRYPTLFQFVQYLNKLTFQLILFPYYYFAYDYVIFDRWKLSGYVYGKATGVNSIINWVMYYTLFGVGLTVILIGKKVVNKIEDSYEKNVELQCKVREIYSNIDSEISNKNIIMLNANDSIERIHQHIVDHLKV